MVAHMADTIEKEQMRTKPVLEDFIASHLSGEPRREALAFLDYCKAKKISYPWSSTNTWYLQAKGKRIGIIWIGGVKAPGQYDEDTLWAVGAGFYELLQYDDFIIKENMQRAILNSLLRCSDCGSFCAPGYACKILGQKYSNLCRAMWILDGKTCINFKNPDAGAIEKVKRIIEYRLTLRHGTASRPVFDPAADGLTRIDNKLRVSGMKCLQGNLSSDSHNMKADYLFDGKYASYVHFFNKEHSNDIVFELDEPVELVMYGLVTGHRLDVPDSWKLYGAEPKDGSWTLLDERDEFPKPVTNFTEKAFKVDAPGAYRRYRFTFEGCRFILSQIHLYAH